MKKEMTTQTSAKHDKEGSNMSKVLLTKISIKIQGRRK